MLESPDIGDIETLIGGAPRTEFTRHAPVRQPDDELQQLEQAQRPIGPATDVERFSGEPIRVRLRLYERVDEIRHEQDIAHLPTVAVDSESAPCE